MNPGKMPTKKWRATSGKATLWPAALLAAVAAAFIAVVQASSQSWSLSITQAQRFEERHHERALLSYLRRGLQFGLPHHAYRKAIEAMRAMESSQRAAASLSAVTALSWGFIGPQPMLGEAPNFGGVTPTGASALAGVTGRLTAIVADPRAPHRFFVGAADGGVWMTNDGGATFRQIADALPTQSIGSLAIDPTTKPNSTLYVGTGEGNQSDDSYYGLGIFATSDFGAHWNPLPATGAPFDEMAIAKIAIDASHHPVHLFATTGFATFSSSMADAIVQEGHDLQDGLWRSSDGGATWSQYSVGTFGCTLFSNAIPCPGGDVVIDPQNPGNVYVSLRATNPFVFRSSDGGNTWRAASFPGIASGGPAVGRTGLAVGRPGQGAPLNCSNHTRPCGTVYAIVGSNDQLTYLGFFKSIDGGVTWTAEKAPCATLMGQGLSVTIDGSTNPRNNSCQAIPKYSGSFYTTALAADPSDPSGRTVVFGGTGPYRSTDSGAHWTFLAAKGGTHTDQHAIAFDPANPGQFLLGNDGGLYRYTPASAAFIPLNRSISAGQIYAIGPHPFDENKLVAGFQDNGHQLFSGLAGWKYLIGGDGFSSLFDHLSPKLVYVRFNGGIARSSDGGLTWESHFATAALRAALATAPADHGGLGPLASDPFVPGRVLEGSLNVYVSNDGMETWRRQTTQNLTDLCGNPGCRIQDLEFVPTDDTRAWALSYNDGEGIFRKGHYFVLANTTQAECPDRPACPGHTSAHWTEVNAHLPFPANDTQATGIAVDPHHGSTAYLSLSGFTAATKVGHIFKTTDFGLTWHRADGAGGRSPLPDVPTMRVLVDRNDQSGNTLYAVTDIGVFRSPDGGATWKAFNLNVIPAVPSFDIEQNDNGVIFVGTHGRGAFRATTTSVPTPTATRKPTAKPTATHKPTATPTRKP